MTAAIATALGVVIVAVVACRAQALGQLGRVRRRLPSSVAAPGPLGALGGPFRPPSRFVVALDEAGFEQPSASVAWSAWVAVAVLAVGLAVVMVGVLGGAVVLLVVGAGPLGGLWSMRGRGDARYETSVPGLLDEVAAELRAGSSLVVSLGRAGERTPGRLGADIHGLVEAVDRGGSFADELHQWAERRPLPAVRLATAALSVGATTGGRQARAVDAVSTTLRERIAVQREAVALATQSRASALVMAVTPIVFAVAASVLDPKVGHVLVATPVGIACLLAGLTLDGAAAAWMARITGARR